MHWFIDQQLPLASEGAERQLIGGEGHHAANALRIRIGEEIVVTNGAGLLAHCECVGVAKAEIRYRVMQSQQVAAPEQQIWLYQALAKGDRDELAIQTATELGVYGVGAWQATRSISKWDQAKSEKGRRRWMQICHDAAKQSQRAWFPIVAEEVSAGLPQNLPGLTILLEPSAQLRVSEINLADSVRVNLVVGPEGGFSPEELAHGREWGYHVARLGVEVLRTSTAGPAAIVLIHSVSGRW